MYLRDLVKKVEAAKADIELKIVRGNAKDYADYRHMIGQVQGMELSIKLITTFIGGEDE